MTDLSPPSVNPTNYGSLKGVMRFFWQKMLQGMDDMLPAIVLAYDRTTNRAQVQPLISMVTTDNIVITRASVQSIPVVQLGGGGFTLNFPIKSGDLGFIKANDRDISLFLQTYQTSVPNTGRKHSFNDAVFIPAALTGYTIADADATNVVLQSLDGTVKISLSDTGVIITAPQTITMTAPEIIMNASTSVALNTPIITGDVGGSAGTMTYNGSITATGTITSNTDVTTGTISLKNHVHGGVQTGSGNTAVPH